jgi:hypothetical protein
VADELCDLFLGDRDLGLREELEGVSNGRMLAWGAWLCVGVAVFSHWLELGSPSLFVLGAVVLGIAGAVSSFAEPAGEGEVRAATFVMAAIPPLIVIGGIALLLVLLAQSDEPWW